MPVLCARPTRGALSGLRLRYLNPVPLHNSERGYPGGLLGMKGHPRQRRPLCPVLQKRSLAGSGPRGSFHGELEGFACQTSAFPGWHPFAGTAVLLDLVNPHLSERWFKPLEGTPLCNRFHWRLRLVAVSARTPSRCETGGKGSNPW